MRFPHFDEPLFYEEYTNKRLLVTVMQLLVISFLVGLVFVLWKRRQTQQMLISCGLPTVFWRPKFVSFRLGDKQKLSSSSITGILPRMKRLQGPHGMYGTVYGISTAVVHVAHPIPARQVLAGTTSNNNDKNVLERQQQRRRSSSCAFNGATKAPAYNHFNNFSGNGVFTSDDQEWKAKRASLLHCLIRNNSRDLQNETNRAADGLVEDVAAAALIGNEGVVDDIVPLLQRATVGLMYRYITHHDGLDTRLYHSKAGPTKVLNLQEKPPSPSTSCSSLTSLTEPSLGDDESSFKREPSSSIPRQASFTNTPSKNETEKKSIQVLLQSYLDSVTNIRMIVLAQSRSIWFLLPRWFYRMFSGMYRQEEETMGPIRAFASMACQDAKPDSPLALLQERSSHRQSSAELMKNKHILDEAITLLFAGQDTSAATLSWTLHLLSLYPSVQNRLAREIESVLREQTGDAQTNGSHLSKRAVMKMPYLDAVIKESMRLYPVAPFVVRKLPHDVSVRGENDETKTTLPCGALVCVWIYALHRNEQLWDRPNVFVPERWLPENKETTGKTEESSGGGAYMPFAAGPRNCVGQPLANVILRILLARMVYQYEWRDPRLNQETDDPRRLLKDMQAGFTVLPSGCVRLEVKKRH